LQGKRVERTKKFLRTILENCDEVLWDDLGLETVPDTIQDIPYARNINLSGNILHNLDGRFQVIPSLQRLHFCRNQLRVVEPSISETVALQVMCALVHATACTSMLKLFQVLHLDHNELETLPHCIFHMPQLRVLTLSHNRLPSTCIPEVIDSFAHPVNLQVCTAQSTFSALCHSSRFMFSTSRGFLWSTGVGAGSQQLGEDRRRHWSIQTAAGFSICALR
jgi:hypothetical protein